ncbi:DUF1707 domain-containing protein [Streptomyces sp. NPDC058953]|uniref:DUF1707 SHOCT-like domain-containing protein n=1 Tax=unclassified Streptomyces TaxID=2593676 RepID=UPI00368410A0
MSELPEMRASDTERERIAEQLREAVAEGRLTMEEFEERLDATYKARTHGELEPLVSDLPVAGGAATAPATAPTAVPQRWSDRIGGVATSKLAVAVWGGFGRKGRWTVPRAFNAFAVMGGGELDLREAHFEERDVVIRCWAIMGGIDVIVPPELNVEVNGFGLMGGFGEEGGGDEGAPDPGAPRVRILGLALMGGVGVRRKRTRADRLRLKAERDEARRQGRLDKGDDYRQLG